MAKGKDDKPVVKVTKTKAKVTKTTAEGLKSRSADLGAGALNAALSGDTKKADALQTRGSKTDKVIRKTGADG